jgi:hypothetical protein
MSFRLKHDVSKEPNGFLRQLNASLPSGMKPDARDLYRIATIEPAAWVLWDGCRLRRTPEGEPAVGDLIQPGMIVTSTFRCGRKITTGPYRVKTVSEHRIAGGPISSWSLVCEDEVRAPNKQPGDSYLNELVALNGRILALFERNDDEVHVEYRPEPSADDALGDLLSNL